MRFSWKKKKWSRSLEVRDSYALNYGGDEVAVLAPISNGYYWYGLGRNTAANPLDIEDAKAQCLAFAKTKLDEMRERFKKVDEKE